MPSSCAANNISNAQHTANSSILHGNKKQQQTNLFRYEHGIRATKKVDRRIRYREV